MQFEVYFWAESRSVASVDLKSYNDAPETEKQNNYYLFEFNQALWVITEIEQNACLILLFTDLLNY